MDKIASCLAEKSWAKCDGFLDAALSAQLTSEIKSLRAANLMRAAGVGRGGDYRLSSSVRSDEIYWLEEPTLSSAQQLAWAKLQDLRQTLNRQLYLGLREIEAHLTHYAPSGHYAKHVDNFQGQSSRILSCIIYLNEDWCPHDGGLLRIYAPDDDTRLLAEVEPRAGTLACFLSRDIPHEVTTTTKDRLSLTGWFR